MKLQCIPNGICSWNFRLTKEGKPFATTTMDWLTETGEIDINGHRHGVKKGGPMSGEWSLSSGLSATKPNPFTRHIEITGPERSFQLEASSPLSSTFLLKSNGKELARIAKAHAFTRRSTIEADESVGEEVLVFAFWLTVLLWRRQRRRSSGGATGGGGGS